MKVCGVYGIVHVPSGRVYVGSSKNVTRRWSEHIGRLQRGDHGVPELARVVLEDGVASLAFVLLESCDVNELKEREQEWFGVFPDLMNVSLNAESPSLDPTVASRIAASLRGRPLSEERRRRISAARKGKPLTDKTKAHLDRLHEALRYRPLHPALIEAWTTPKTPEHRANLSAAAKKRWTGRPKSEEHRQRLSESARAYYRARREGS